MTERSFSRGSTVSWLPKGDWPSRSVKGGFRNGEENEDGREEIADDRKRRGRQEVRAPDRRELGTKDRHRRHERWRAGVAADGRIPPHSLFAREDFQKLPYVRGGGPDGALVHRPARADEPSRSARELGQRGCRRRDLQGVPDQLQVVSKAWALLADVSARCGAIQGAAKAARTHHGCAQVAR